MKRIKTIINFSILINYIVIILLIFIFLNSKVKPEKISSIDNKKYENKSDIIRPDIILNDEDLEIYLFENYQEPGYYAIDNIDGDITDKVQITSDLNNKKEGIYKIIYTVLDSSGNETEVSRNIIVKNRNTPNSYTSTITDKEEINNLLNELNNYLKDYNVSVGYINLNTNFTYLYNENKEYFGASLIKTLDAMYVYELDIKDEKMIANVASAISRSDNNAHAYLVNNIGIDNLKSYSNSLGEPLLYCNDRFFCNTNVKTQLTYLLHLYTLINTLDNGQELSSYFINDYGNYLNLENKTFLHKYGQSDNYYHDVGIYNGENPYIIVILTSERLNPNISHIKLINNISFKISELNDLIINS